jgi:hypothetical protein
VCAGVEVAEVVAEQAVVHGGAHAAIDDLFDVSREAVNGLLSPCKVIDEWGFHDRG